MTKNMRTIAARTGAVLVEGLDAAAMVAAAGVGGWVGYNAPIPFGTPASSAAFAGVLGLALAVGATELLDSVMASLRALTRTSSSASTLTQSPHTGQDAEEALPNTPEDLVDRLNQAARADSAHQAATHSYRIDHARDLLNSDELWVGYEDNTAWFPLADGAYVQYRNTHDEGSAHHEYTFIIPSANAEPVTLTSMAQLRDLMAQHVNREPQEEQVGA